jgi:hypothetical protein
VLHLMISLCPWCHAKVGCKKSVLRRGQRSCSNCGENNIPSVMNKPTLDFKAKGPAASTAPLFLDRLTGRRQTFAPSLSCFGRI